MMQQVNIMPGRKILAEESSQPASGKNYLQLRKVKLGDATPSEPEQISEDLSWADEAMETSPSVSEATSDSWKQDTPVAPAEAPSEAPSYEAGTNARWAIGMAYRAYQQVMGTPEGADGEFPFDAVLLHAQELVGMFEILKNPGYTKAKQTADKLPRSEDSQ